jgi:asparagine synthase (glutamine-hydrolysing)
MATGDGSAWITYNGEIYNYQELRRELIRLGYEFRTSSDTEVILNAYLAWGERCVERLRGMFAFGIWDARRKRVVLARDRMGIKPLVYAWDGHSLRFASEVKGILADPEVPREIDWDSVQDYLTYLYIPGPRTIFRSIHKLPPASYLICGMDGKDPEIHRYWDLRMGPPLEEGRQADWVARLDELLHEAVRLHMVSDVPVGAFLSGGVDSSSVVACMARASVGPVKTFSIGFDEEAFDELRYARQVASRYGTEHVEMVVKPDVVEVLPRLAWQFDEPFGDASAVPTYCVSRITRDHVTVALSGDGGDENFAGYRRYAEALRLHQRFDRMPGALVRPILRWAGARRAPGARGRDYLTLRGMSPMERYWRMLAYQTDETLRRMVTEEVAAGMTRPASADAFADLAGEAGTDDYVATLQYVDMHHYLPEDILVKVDRASMLTSLETRVPLLDHVLVEHVARMPTGVKLRDGLGKHVLKEAMRPYLPREILSRRKMGFGVPLASWFRRELRDFTQDILSDRRTRERGIIRPEATRALVDVHLSGQRDYSSQLWSLVCFELWARAWWDR